MKDVNFDAIYEHVHTQYGDLTGVIQIDGHSNVTSIYNLCADFSVSMNDKFIIGFGMEESTILGAGSNGTVHCTIWTVEKKDYGSTYDQIEKTILASNDRALKVKRTTISVPYSVMGKYIKRFSFLATSELTKHVHKIEFVHDPNF